MKERGLTMANRHRMSFPNNELMSLRLNTSKEETLGFEINIVLCKFITESIESPHSEYTQRTHIEETR